MNKYNWDEEIEKEWKMVHVVLYDYFDVWGDQDGWQVNNQYVEWDGYISKEIFDDRQKTLDFLKDDVAFINTTDPERVELECVGDGWFINAADNGQPLGALMLR